MSRFHFHRILLVSVLLSLCISQGLGRVSKSFVDGDSVALMEQNNEQYVEKGREREMMELMDYPDPGPNPRRSPWLTPPFSPPPPKN